MIFLLMLALTAVPVQCAPTEVTIPSYGTFNATILETGLPQAVTAWLGIEYATQPINDSRYEIQSAPAAFEGVKQAADYGNICMQGTDDPRPTGMGEDCLSLNIFRPANVSSDQLLPVAFYIHGGSFNTGSSKDVDSAAFIANSKSPIMMVSINYRVGAFGFPSSEAFSELGLLNLGFHDQYTALKFVHDNIGYFGGDASQVTVMGVSAGAHSTGYEYLNVEADGEPLLARAIMHSGSPTSRAYPNASYPLYKQQWSQFVETVGCDDTANSTTLLACLKTVDADLTRTTSADIYNINNYAITWPWQPVLDGFLIPRPAHESWEQGLFNKVPVLTGFCTNEGNTFVPQNLSTNDQFVDFFRNLLPNITEAHIQEIASLYPDPTSNSSSPYADSPLSPQYSRLGAAYGDYSYICQTQQTALSVTSFNITTYKYHFGQNVSYPPYIGIGHACGASAYQWNGAGLQSPRVAEVYSGYLTSFVATGNPNTFKFDDATLDWPEYGSSELQMFINDTNSGPQFDGMRLEQCRFWESIPGELNH